MPQIRGLYCQRKYPPLSALRISKLQSRKNACRESFRKRTAHTASSAVPCTLPSTLLTLTGAMREFPARKPPASPAVDVHQFRLVSIHPGQRPLTVATWKLLCQVAVIVIAILPAVALFPTAPTRPSLTGGLLCAEQRTIKTCKAGKKHQPARPRANSLALRWA